MSVINYVILFFAGLLHDKEMVSGLMLSRLETASYNVDRLLVAIIILTVLVYGYKKLDEL